MYDYNSANYNQAGGMMMEQQQQTVPNVMMDEGYGVQVPLEGVQTTATIDGTTTTIPVISVTDTEGPPFDIPDQVMRRVFARKIIGILMLQYVCYIPIMEIFLLSVDGPLDVTIYFSFLTLRLILYAIMYAFSEFRRNPPVNMAILVTITLLQGVGEGIFATFIGGQTALFPPLVIVFQLVVLLAYSKQDRFKFSNINAMILMLLIFIIGSLIFKVILPTYYIHASITSIFSVCYFVYDIHLMLTGFHGYNMNSDEHIFAVTNIYADFPHLFWRQLRYVFNCLLDNIRFLRNCFFAEVC